MQAQLQLDYANASDAVVLLELVEAVHGESISSGLMLCKAWMMLKETSKLEKKAYLLLRKMALDKSQRAALYFCLSTARWQANDPHRARKAYRAYKALLKQEDVK